MKPAIEHPGLNSARSRRASRVLFAISLLFWPVFMLLTILEEKAGMSWLQTENATLWRPIAVGALLSAVVAPLFLDVHVSKKIAASVCSLHLFAAIYGVVVLVGASFLNWGD